MFHFFQKYKHKKDFAKDVLKESFDTEDSDFQNFYYYHEAVLDRFSTTLDVYDWEHVEAAERKP